MSAARPADAPGGAYFRPAPPAHDKHVFMRCAKRGRMPPLPAGSLKDFSGAHSAQATFADIQSDAGPRPPSQRRQQGPRRPDLLCAGGGGGTPAKRPHTQSSRGGRTGAKHDAAGASLEDTGSVRNASLSATSPAMSRFERFARPACSRGGARSPRTPAAAEGAPPVVQSDASHAPGDGTRRHSSHDAAARTPRQRYRLHGGGGGADGGGWQEVPPPTQVLSRTSTAAGAGDMGVCMRGTDLVVSLANLPDDPGSERSTPRVNGGDTNVGAWVSSCEPATHGPPAVAPLPRSSTLLSVSVASLVVSPDASPRSRQAVSRVSIESDAARLLSTFAYTQPHARGDPRPQPKTAKPPILTTTADTYATFLEGTRGLSFMQQHATEYRPQRRVSAASTAASCADGDGNGFAHSPRGRSASNTSYPRPTPSADALGGSLSDERALVEALNPDPPKDVCTGRLPSLSVKSQKSLVMFSKVHGLKLHTPDAKVPRVLRDMHPSILKTVFLALCDDRGRLRPRQLPEIFAIVGLAPYSRIRRNDVYNKLIAPLVVQAAESDIHYSTFKQALATLLVWDPLDVLGYLFAQLRKGHIYRATSVVTKGEILAMFEAFRDAVRTYRATRPEFAARHPDLGAAEAALGVLLPELEEHFTFVGRMPLEDFTAIVRQQPVLRGLVDPPGFLESVLRDVSLPPALASHMVEAIEARTSERMPDAVDVVVPTQIRWPPAWNGTQGTPLDAAVSANPKVLQAVEKMRGGRPLRANHSNLGGSHTARVSLSERTSVQEALGLFERAGGRLGPYASAAQFTTHAFDVSSVNFTLTK